MGLLQVSSSLKSHQSTCARRPAGHHSRPYGSVHSTLQDRPAHARPLGGDNMLRQSCCPMGLTERLVTRGGKRQLPVSADWALTQPCAVDPEGRLPIRPVDWHIGPARALTGVRVFLLPLLKMLPPSRIMRVMAHTPCASADSARQQTAGYQPNPASLTADGTLAAWCNFTHGMTRSQGWKSPAT